MKLNFGKINLKDIKINKDTLKNPKFYMVVGGIVLVIVLIFIITRPQQAYVEQSAAEIDRLSDEQAKNVIESLMKNAIDVYENPGNIFKVSDASIDIEEKKEEKEENKEEKKEEKQEEKKENNAKLISNYDEVMKTIFTEKGIKEFEKMIFKDKKYVYKKNDIVYFINDVIDKDYVLSDVTFNYSKFSVKKESISCNVNFNKVDIDEVNTVNYYIITKAIKIVKSGDNWLIDSFVYTNG